MDLDDQSGVAEAPGSGLVTGAADDDLAGIGTYAVAGASPASAPLWTALVTCPLMAPSSAAGASRPILR